MWLSLVERCVRDAEVVGSNPAIPTIQINLAGRPPGLSSCPERAVLEALFHYVGYGLCHQLSERSSFGGGYQLPVCARDTGIYSGFILGIVAVWLLSRGTKPTELPWWPVLTLIAVFVGLMGFDGVTSYAGLRETTNDIRLFTGVITGWGLATISAPMVNTQIWKYPGAGRVVEGWRQVAGWLGLLGLAYAIMRWIMPLLGVVYPLLLTAAILATFVTVNLVFVGLTPPFERKAERLRDAWPQMAIALGLTALELGGASLLRVLAERFIF